MGTSIRLYDYDPKMKRTLHLKSKDDKARESQKVVDIQDVKH